MSRKLTSRSSLENLKREAKRWLKAIRAGETEARARLAKVLSQAPAEPTLRDIQHALAREHGFDGWSALSAAVDALPRAGGLSELLAAAERGDAAGVREILDAVPGLVNQRDARGTHRTPNGVALWRQARGARACPARLPGDEDMAIEIVKLFLMHGADPLVRNSEGLTAGDIAERRGMFRAATLLRGDVSAS